MIHLFSNPNLPLQLRLIPKGQSASPSRPCWEEGLFTSVLRCNSSEKVFKEPLI